MQCSMGKGDKLGLMIMNIFASFKNRDCKCRGVTDLNNKGK